MIIDGKMKLNTDASAAVGICQRRGMGKMRHIDVGILWIQDEVSQNRVQVVKVKGTENWADNLAKAMGVLRLRNILT